MIINHKIIRTMREYRSQYLGSTVLIIVSCLLYTMLNLLAANMLDLTSALAKNYAQEDAAFSTGQKLSDISELESKFNARIEEGEAFDYDVARNKTLRIFSENSKVNIPAIIEGKNLSGNDILVDPAFAKANQLKIGNEIRILAKSFRIAGFMSLPNYIYVLKSENDILNNPSTFGIAVISKEDFAGFNKGNSFYAIKFNSLNGSPDTQAAQFRDYLKSKGIIISQWTDTGENPRVTYVTAKIQGISRISSSIPVAVLLLTCILTGIVIRRLLNREAAIIGTLYAIGYKKREIIDHYMRYPLLIALAGGSTGTILGIVLLKPMLNYMVAYFELPVIFVGYYPGTILISLLLPVFFLSFSGYFVLNGGLRCSPVELMRGGRKKTKVNFIERGLTLDKLKFPTKFKLRQQLRSLSRLIFLLLGVIMATMLLLLGFTAKSSLDNLMQDNLRNTFKFQYEYVYNSLREDQPPAGTEAFAAANFTLKSDNRENTKVNFRICGINPGSQFIILRDKTGAGINTDKVIITGPLAERLQVFPGSTIRVINKLDSREYAVTVEQVAETYIGDYIFMPLARYNGMLGLPPGSYTGLWSKDKLDIPANLLYSSESVDETIKAFNASLEPIQSTVGVIAFISFILGLLVIYVVISLIIEENRENISLMKIFGYRRKEINSLIINSTSPIVVLGYLLGIPLLLASMSRLFRTLTQSVNLTLPVTISYPYILAGFLIVYLTYELSKALSRKKINRIDMGEALKSGRDRE